MGLPCEKYGFCNISSIIGWSTFPLGPILLYLSRKMLDCRTNEYIARTGIEVVPPLDNSVCHNRQSGYSINVVHYVVLCRMTQK